MYGHFILLTNLQHINFKKIAASLAKYKYFIQLRYSCMGGGSFTNVEEFHPKYHNIEKYAFSNGRIAYCSLLTGKKPSTVARLTPPMITWLFISLKIKWWPFWTSHLSHSCIIKVCLGQDLSQKRQMPPTILSQSQTTVLISILVLLDKLTQHRFLT